MKIGSDLGSKSASGCATAIRVTVLVLLWRWVSTGGIERYDRWLRAFMERGGWMPCVALFLLVWIYMSYNEVPNASPLSKTTKVLAELGLTILSAFTLAIACALPMVVFLGFMGLSIKWLLIVLTTTLIGVCVVMADVKLYQWHRRTFPTSLAVQRYQRIEGWLIALKNRKQKKC